MRSFLKSLQQRLSNPSSTRPGANPPTIESLEPRLLLSTYHLSYDNEFNALPTIAQTVGSATPGMLPTDYWNNHSLSGNAEQEYYVFPGIDSGYNPFSVSNGVLSITANPTPTGMDADGQPYVSGELTTSKGANYSSDIQSSTPFSQEYGYFEMRAKLPAGKGLWPAFWLMPANGGQAAEYDIFEVLGNDTTSIYQSSHWDSYAGNNGYDYQNQVDSADGFHTYGFEWDASNIRWYVDGVLTRTYANHSNTPMYMLMNLAVGGSWPGNPDSTTPWPSSMDIDYVRVYSNDPNVPTIQPQSGYDGSLPGEIDTPTTPTNFAASTPNPGEIDLSWGPVDGATSYNLYRSTTPGGEGATPYQSGLTDTSFDETGLLGGTSYYYTVQAVNIIGSSSQSAEVHATTPATGDSVLINFSDLTTSDYSSIPNSYQPDSLAGTGITMTWSGVKRYGTHTYDGYIDHTKSLDSSAPSIDIGTGSASGQWTTSMHMDFSAPVEVSSIYVTNWDSWEQGVTLKGYTNTTDSSPAVTVTLTDADIPNHSTGNPNGSSWVNVTGLAGVPIQRLEIIGTKASSTSQYGMALVDDMTISPAGSGGATTAVVDDTGSGINYVGSWTAKTNDANRIDGTGHYSHTPGDYFDYTFNGTSIELVSVLAPNRGKADVYIDGVLDQTIDTYHPSNVYRQTVYEKQGLSAGTHTIKVVLRSDKDSGATGTYTSIDEFIVNPVSVDDTASSVSYSGNWTSVTDYADRYLGTGHYSANAGDSAEITFTGTSFTWIGGIGPNRGMADIYVDGSSTPTATVDLYAGSYYWQHDIWSINGLSDGSHTIQIVVRSDHNANATNYYVPLDEFLIA